MSKNCQQLPTIWSIPDELWDEIKPLLKVDTPKKKPGRPIASNRKIWNGLIYLARTGCQWSALPREFGPKSTVYERFREWLSQGCLEKVWIFWLEKSDGTIGIAWEWVDLPTIGIAFIVKFSVSRISYRFCVGHQWMINQKGHNEWLIKGYTMND